MCCFRKCLVLRGKLEDVRKQPYSHSTLPILSILSGQITGFVKILLSKTSNWETLPLSKPPGSPVLRLPVGTWTIKVGDLDVTFLGTTIFGWKVSLQKVSHHHEPPDLPWTYIIHNILGPRRTHKKCEFCEGFLSQTRLKKTLRRK